MTAPPRPRSSTPARRRSATPGTSPGRSSSPTTDSGPLNKCRTTGWCSLLPVQPSAALSPASILKQNSFDRTFRPSSTSGVTCHGYHRTPLAVRPQQDADVSHVQREPEPSAPEHPRACLTWVIPRSTSRSASGPSTRRARSGTRPRPVSGGWTSSASGCTASTRFRRGPLLAYARAAGRLVPGDGRAVVAAPEGLALLDRDTGRPSCVSGRAGQPGNRANDTSSTAGRPAWSARWPTTWAAERSAHRIDCLEPCASTASPSPTVRPSTRPEGASTSPTRRRSRRRLRPRLRDRRALRTPALPRPDRGGGSGPTA